MCLVSDSTPFDIEAKYRGLKTLLRLSLSGKCLPKPTNPRKLKFPSHQSILSSFDSNSSSQPAAVYDLTSITVFTSPLFNVIFPSPSTLKDMVSSFASTLQKADFPIFTDGSKMADRVGAGYVIYGREGNQIHTECWSLNSQHQGQRVPGRTYCD